MKKLLLPVFVIFLSLACAQSNLPQAFNVLSANNTMEPISLLDLDDRARKYISDEWGEPLAEIEKWELVNARYQDNSELISLSYERKIMAPLVIVAFDKHGNPDRIMGYK